MSGNTAHEGRSGSEESGENVMDLNAIAWDEIKQAASESPWMPPEYTMNDWVSDVCAFLREAQPVSSGEQGPAESVSHSPNSSSVQPDETAKLREEIAQNRQSAKEAIEGIIETFKANLDSLKAELAESQKREAAALAAVRDKDEVLLDAANLIDHLGGGSAYHRRALAKQPDASALEEKKDSANAGSTDPAGQSATEETGSA